jgi:hypothetical protein
MAIFCWHLPAVENERGSVLNRVDDDSGVPERVRRQAGRVGPASLGFAAVAPAVLAGRKPISVVFVAQQVL